MFSAATLERRRGESGTNRVREREREKERRGEGMDE